jgi:S-DNA-T family DNA segregation ATPase FtsK/SpoIIIE
LAWTKACAAWLLGLPPTLGVLGAPWLSGVFGGTVSAFLTGVFGRVGAVIVVLGLLLAAAIALTDLALPARAHEIRRALTTAALGLARRAVQSLDPRRVSARARGPFRAVAAGMARGLSAVRRTGRRADPTGAAQATPVPNPARGALEFDPAVWREAESALASEPGIVDPRVLEAASSVKRTVKRVHRTEGERKRPASEFELPPLDLLSPAPPRIERTSRRDLLDLSETLRRTLEEFGIRGRVSEVHPGPVITRYDFEPAPGVKVNQIVSREDDIALALRTDRIRILTRLPGKAAVGIEIPNDQPDLIPFVELAAAPLFTSARGALTLALGKDTAGRPFCDHLETMPHLLVAGTTGSGKSVCINTIIASLLFRHRPEDLRLILIDPKMLELTGYNGIAHLALPVVTESKDAAKALNWLVREMERRYRLLAARSVRNIQTYREKFFGPKPPPREPEEAPPEPMPYIVCIVDELADLMMTNASEVETPIARLAQMARAVGIHLILATQRPSVDVLTGVIKANFPARIAFQVASKIDSRTILDQNGAESLVGRGDMLYLQSGRSVPIRVHGAFLPDPDIEGLVRYLRSFVSDLAPIDIEEKSSLVPGEAGGEDPLFAEAARVVVLQGQASTSLLQRRLKIGYARAGRLIDQLEGAGIVSRFEGSKARDVLVDLEYLEKQGIV